MAGTRWTPQETLAAFDLYLRTPFGRQHNRNPEIVALAESIGRSANSVNMKLNNFSGLDPTEIARGIRGLTNRSQADVDLFDRFLEEPEQVTYEASVAFDAVTAGAPAAEPDPPDFDPPGFDTPVEATEAEATVRVRRVQRAFRRGVLASYGGECALTGCRSPAFLVASHIIPWRAAGRRRADPRIGVCLNVLHDRAFDRGLFTLSDDLSVVVSHRLPDDAHFGRLAPQFAELSGRQLATPTRFSPLPDALAYHREYVFQA